MPENSVLHTAMKRICCVEYKKGQNDASLDGSVCVNGSLRFERPPVPATGFTASKAFPKVELFYPKKVSLLK
jgi:hypothetical protein